VYAALGIGLEAGLLIDSGLAYYRGFIAGPVFIIVAIFIFYVSRQETYHEAIIRWIYCIAFSFAIIGLALAIVDLVLSGMCDDDDDPCDSSNVHAIKIVILCLYIITVIHSIAAMIIVTVGGKNSAITQPILGH
jgi:hypothetical protein